MPCSSTVPAQPGRHDGRRLRELPDGRAGAPLARHRRAAQHRGVERAAVEHRPARRCAPIAARRRRGSGGRRTFLDRAHPHVHQLDRGRPGRDSRSGRSCACSNSSRSSATPASGAAVTSSSNDWPAVAHVVVGLEAGVRHAGARRAGELAHRGGASLLRSPPRPTAGCAPCRGAGLPLRARARTAPPPRAGRARAARPAARPAARRASGRRRRTRPARSRAGRRRARPSRRAARAASPRPRRARSRPPSSRTSRPSSPARVADRGAGGLADRGGRPGQRRLGAEVAEQQVCVRDGGLTARRVRRPPAPAPRPRTVGPTRRAPPASAQAMLPPPAPTVWMSTIGSCSARPPISCSEDWRTTPSSITATSHEVPPMSKERTRSLPDSAAGARGADCSGRGSGQHGPGGVPARLRGGRQAAVRSHDLRRGQAGLGCAARTSRSRYPARRGERYASITVVDVRSYSRKTASRSCEAETCTPGSRSATASATRRSWLRPRPGVQQADGYRFDLLLGEPVQRRPSAASSSGVSTLARRVALDALRSAARAARAAKGGPRTGGRGAAASGAPAPARR